jgi:hypothetical protein
MESVMHNILWGVIMENKKVAIGTVFTVKTLNKYETLPIKDGEYKIVHDYFLPFDTAEQAAQEHCYVALALQKFGIGGVVEITEELFEEMYEAGYIKISE